MRRRTLPFAVFSMKIVQECRHRTPKCPSSHIGAPLPPSAQPQSSFLRPKIEALLRLAMPVVLGTVSAIWYFVYHDLRQRVEVAVDRERFSLPT